MTKINEFFDGKKLYGDDLSLDEINKWFNDEKEGYSSLLNEDYIYEFHQLNKLCGFDKIKGLKKFKKVLGFGSAGGDELIPIAEKIDEIVIIEPSDKLKNENVFGKKTKYLKPNVNGKIALPEESFDIVTCFGVLHHIPNVSFVFSELARVLKKGGYLLIREPIVSMGDWNFPRNGLTKRERGIPLNLFREIIKKNNLRIVSETKVIFPVTKRINFGKFRAYNSRIVTFLDIILSRLFSWNYRYHSTKPWHKIQPQSVFYVLKKENKL